MSNTIQIPVASQPFLTSTNNSLVDRVWYRFLQVIALVGNLIRSYQGGTEILNPGGKVLMQVGTAGKVIFPQGLPSDPTGLPSGSLWYDIAAANTIKFVP